MLAILSACGQSDDLQKNVEGRQLSPAQAACIEGVKRKQISLDAEFSAQHIEALRTQRSSIGIILAQRRAHEQMCMEYAKCFGLNEPFLSTMFEACLKGAERPL